MKKISNNKIKNNVIVDTDYTLCILWWRTFFMFDSPLFSVKKIYKKETKKS